MIEHLIELGYPDASWAPECDIYYELFACRPCRNVVAGVWWECDRNSFTVIFREDSSNTTPTVVVRKKHGGELGFYKAEELVQAIALVDNFVNTRGGNHD
jgi:hypothetical protein